MFICINGSVGAIKNSYVFQTYGTWQAVQSKIARIAGKWSGATFYLDNNRNLYIDLTNTSAQTFTVTCLEATKAKVSIDVVSELPDSVTELSCNQIGIDSIPDPPTASGAYNLQCSVPSSGTPSYAWQVSNIKLNKFTATTYRPSGFQIVCTGLVKVDFIKYSDTGEVLEYIKGYIDGSENLAMIQEKSTNANLYYDSTYNRFVISCSMSTGEKKLTVATILSGEITAFAFY
jgi:hypothetical protein